MAQVSYGLYVLCVTVLKETQSTDPNQWLDLILSPSTTGLLTEGALLLLCRLLAL